MDSVTWTRILATTDFSPFANRAVSYAHRLAEQSGAELHVLHVAKSVSAMVAEHGTTGRFDPTDESEGAQWLGDLLGESGQVRRVEAVRVGSDVAQTIVHYAKSNAIELIIMATHGRTGLSHAILGSIAENVLRSAPCPVLVIPRTVS